MIPLFVPPLSFCIEKIYVILDSPKNRAIKYILPIIILCTVFGSQLLTTGKHIYSNLTSSRKDEYVALGKLIDENTNKNDRITVIGNRCVVYLFVNRESASKYIYQYPIGEISEKIAISYQNDIDNVKPAIVVIPIDGWHKGMMTASSPISRVFSNIIDMLNREYFLLYEDDSVRIFKRQGAG
jgi:hypothetical protein